MPYFVCRYTFDQDSTVFFGGLRGLCAVLPPGLTLSSPYAELLYTVTNLFVTILYCAKSLSLEENKCI